MKKENVQANSYLKIGFIENRKFEPIREIINSKFNEFFEQLISSVPEVNQEQLNKSKRKLLEIIYSLVFRRIQTSKHYDKYLTDTAAFLY